MNLKTTDFGVARRLKVANFLVQLVLLVVIYLQVNYLGTRFYKRTDLTPADIHSLSIETQAYLRKIDPQKPVRVIVTSAPKANEESEELWVRNQIHKTLKEYEHHANKGGATRFIVEYVDIYMDRDRARELSRDYNLREENSILFTCGKQIRLIPAAQLKIPAKNGIRANAIQFSGERLFTSSILHVIQDEKDRVYFLQGHGELLLDQADPVRGVTDAAAFLQYRNVDPLPLNLQVAGRIPADAKLLIIASPQFPFTLEELILLKDYLDKRNGRLLALVDPFVNHGLDEIFREWGIEVDDRLVIEPPDNSALSIKGTTLVREYSRHQITQSLGEDHIPVLFGQSRPVRPDFGAPNDETRSVASLLFSREGSWAEVDYRESKTPTQDPIDPPGPISLGAVSERKAGQQGIHIAGGKVTVFGNSKWLTNNGFKHRGNQRLLHNCLMWNLDRFTLLDIPPRPILQYEANLDTKEFTKLKYSRLLVPPLAIFALGIICYFTRRH